MVTQVITPGGKGSNTRVSTDFPIHVPTLLNYIRSYLIPYLLGDGFSVTTQGVKEG